MPSAEPSRRWILVAAILGSSLAFIDGTVVNVALPAIQRDLNASAAEAQWVMESYGLFLSSLLLVGGSLGDRFGLRRVFMLGVALFIAASMACAISVTAAQLIAARSVQGVGAALLVPGSLALISAGYPAQERGAAIGTWSGFSAIAAAIGPVIGGFLVDHFSWKWAFLVNVPLGALLLVICATRVNAGHPGADTKGVDFPGATLATVGLAGVIFALIEAPFRGWTAFPMLAAAVIGVAALALFIRVESRSRAPMLPLALFANRNFAGANLLTFLLYAALGGGLYFLPLNLIQVQGYSAVAAGATLLPFIVIMFVLSRWAGSLVATFGSKLPLVIGPIIAALGFALLAAPGIDAPYWTTFFPAICVLGLGMSITVAPLTTTVMNAVASQTAGTASGVNNAVSRTAGLLAIAIFGVVMAVAFDGRMNDALAAMKADPKVIASIAGQRHMLAAIAVPEGLPADVTSELHRAIGVAFVSGFRWVMLLSAGLGILSAASAWLLIDGAGQKQRPPGGGL